MHAFFRLALGLLVAAPVSARIELIEATDTEIRVHLDAAVEGAVRLVEIEPYDRLDPLRGLVSARPDNHVLDLSRGGFLRTRFVDSGAFDAQLAFPDHAINADLVRHFALRARLVGVAGGAAMPLRVRAGAGHVDVSLPGDGEWHILRADLASETWNGSRTLRIDPAEGQPFAPYADAILDLDWVAVTHRDDYSGDRRHTGADVFIDLGVPASSWAGAARSTITLPRRDGPRDRLFAKYLLLDDATGRQIGAARYVTDLSGLSYRRESDEGWSSTNLNTGMGAARGADGVLVANYTVPAAGTWDPGIVASATDLVDFDVARELALRFRIRGYTGPETELPLAVFGFATGAPGNARFDAWAPLDGEWQILRIRLDRSETTLPWSGPMRLRIDTPNNFASGFPAAHFAGATLEIDWIAVSDDPAFVPGAGLVEGGRVWGFEDRAPQALRQPAGIKGVDGIRYSDKVDLGVQVNKMNLGQRTVIDLAAAPAFVWPVDEFQVGINRTFVENTLRPAVKLLHDNQATTHIIFLNSLQDPWLDAGTPNQRFNPLRHALTSTAAPNAFSVAHNVGDPVGLAHYRGTLEYLARYFSDPTGRNGEIFRFTIGNELDEHWTWYNIGEVELEEIVELYLTACRIADLALRSQHPDFRIKLSFTHHWNRTNIGNPLRAANTRAFLERFAARAREEGDFPWALNIHTYPENLRKQDFWNDVSPTDDFDTARITFKNLQVIRRFLQQERMLHRGEVRPITLGEQGFDVVTSGDALKEAVQAAALAYSFKIAEQVPDLESYLYHRQVDHQNEGNLLFGLWAGDPAAPEIYQPFRKRESWFVMRDYGTPAEAATFAPYLQYLPIDAWSQIHLADLRLRYAFDAADPDITARNLVSAQTAGGVFAGTVDHPDPQLINAHVNTYGDGHEILRLRVRSAQAGNWQLFWRRAGDPGFAASRSITFHVPDSADFITRSIDLGAVKTWVGQNLVAWRLDPPGSAGAAYAFEIDSLVFDPITPPAVSRAVWTGASDGRWSAAENWERAPVPGTALEFGGIRNLDTYNDHAPGMRFGNITLGADAAFVLAGNPLRLEGDIAVASSPAAYLKHRVALNLELGGERTITARANGDLELSGAISGAGGIRAAGFGTVILSGENSYAGDTVVTAGTLHLAPTGALRFGIGASGVNNRLAGEGGVVLDGALVLDLAGAGAAPGDSWTVVEIGTLSMAYGATFRVADFVARGHGIWTKQAGDVVYVFSQYDGTLSVAAGGPTVYYDLWAAGVGLAPEERGPLAAPAGDGLANLLKYAFGLSSLESAAGLSVTTASLAPDGGLQLAAVVRADDDTLDVTARASVDLVDWGLAVLEVGDVDQAGVPLGFSRRVWRSAEPVAARTRLFLRLEIQLAPGE